jgi:hypothetical protein
MSSKKASLLLRSHLHGKRSRRLQDPPNFEFFDPVAPIFTSPRFLPPARVIDCTVEDAIIAHGAMVRKSTISNAIIGLRSVVRRNGRRLSNQIIFDSSNFHQLVASSRMKNGSHSTAIRLLLSILVFGQFTQEQVSVVTFLQPSLL